jgi:hypothetical protein
MSLLAFPSVSSAGVMDYIHAMSGPRMVGVGVIECEVYLYRPEPNRPSRSCDSIVHAIIRLVQHEHRLPAPDFVEGDVRLTFNPAVYKSIPHSSEGTDYPGKIGMVTAEPLFEVGVRSYGRVLFNVGVGFSVAGLFGTGFEPFANAGFKFRPVGLTIDLGQHDVDIAANFRFFPVQFLPEDFGLPSEVANTNRRGEWVRGFSVGVRF